MWKRGLIALTVFLILILCSLNEIGLPDIHHEYEEERQEERKLTQEAEASLVPKDFTADSCKCRDYTVSDAEPVGAEGLACRYDWAGLNTSDNRLGFAVTFYHGDHVDELQPGYDSLKKDLVAETTTDISPDQAVTVLEDDILGYAYMITGPGGLNDSGEPIPLCGKGNGVYIWEQRYLIQTDLRTCDLGSVDVIQAALTDMRDCAENAIDASRNAHP